MSRRVDGRWCLQLALTPGHHRYRFLVDGRPKLDPRSAGKAVDKLQGEVSLVPVSQVKLRLENIGIAGQAT